MLRGNPQHEPDRRIGHQPLCDMLGRIGGRRPVERIDDAPHAELLFGIELTVI